MLDFLKIVSTVTNKGLEIRPVLRVGKTNDLMIRGSDFYAVWLEDEKRWSTDEDDVLQLIDRYLDEEAAKQKEKYEGKINVLHMWDTRTRMIQYWHTYCKQDMRDRYHELDEKIIFSNEKTGKKDYSSKKLNYPLEEGSYENYDKLISKLYSEEERNKIEWAIGAIITGDSKKIQKFLVLYGSAGTGKSTILNIIQQLFDGYYSTFDAKALGSSSASFALESFKNNPLVAIQHDGDLSRIEDNTRLNSLVSHELMTVNEKFKSTYSTRFNSFLFMGTNKPVKITDAKSGLIRRLIDVTPTGEKFTQKEYKELIKQIPFELGAIAYHCKEVYLSDPGKYDNYIPVNMMGASNDFYNFVQNEYFKFEEEDGVTLQSAWERYDLYCSKTNTNKVPYRVFREELKNYFDNFYERLTLDDGTRVRSYYKGFKTKIFDYEQRPISCIAANESKFIFKEQHSLLDDIFADCPAQYANDEGIPTSKWSFVKTKLSDLDTTKLHYVKVPDETHIFLDFDIRDEAGNKSFEKNLEAASNYPLTYAELSKSGEGIHLHYIYDGDPFLLEKEIDKNIEIKVCKGDSSIRRKLSKCNDIPIAHINSGLPLKKEAKKVVNPEKIKSEKGLRDMIRRNIRKEIHGYTKPSMDFIKKILDDAYASGMDYDVSDSETVQSLIDFAMSSTHNADYCLKLIGQMKLKSDVIESNDDSEFDTIIFYDVEVFPNLCIVNYKPLDVPGVIRLINPKPEEIEKLIRYKLIGFNCRRYDNHILYAIMLGWSNYEIYNLSQGIINKDKGVFFPKAWDISYLDLYDVSAKKQSLKKFEIELKIHHQELGLKWDEPVPEELWEKVAEYCDNDVIATEAVYKYLRGDIVARKILSALADMKMNDTTNSLTTKIIFQGNQNPQTEFNYRDMGNTTDAKCVDGFDEFTMFDSLGRPVFPGYRMEKGKSVYRGEEVGEGGYVYSEPGMYGNVALLDIASMHPSSIIAEKLFGEFYTDRFKDIVQARIYIKHGDFDKARTMLDGALAPFLDDESNAKSLAMALKIAINSVYGLTDASFPNPFRDPRNIDNIVAKRGALFMVNLKHEVQKRGFTVAHIKTDSIKIPDATPEIIQFVMEYGKMYGYNFEHEATYERMCLVNDAVYIAKYDDGGWTATGTQFQVPYVFKTLFSHEDLEFDDFCETKSVSAGSIYMDFNESLDDDEHNYVFIGKVGQFTPVKEGSGGGVLYREKDGKYYAVTGTKGYRWLESEIIRNINYDDIIDKKYYDEMAMEAKMAVDFYGRDMDLIQGCNDWFYSDVPYNGPKFENGHPVYLEAIVL